MDAQISDLVARVIRFSQALREKLLDDSGTGDPPRLQDVEAWVEAFGDRLFRYALLRTGKREIAEDLVQETFLAAVNGLAIGGGVTLPLAVADQIYLSEHAWARLPFANLGISAELGSTFMLPRLLGMQKAKELFFYPETLSAEHLVELGLVNAVLPHDDLIAHTRDKALQLIPPRGAGASIRAMKRIVHAQKLDELTRALDLENEALNQLMQSGDFAEALTARMEKRDPVFSGR